MKYLETVEITHQPEMLRKAYSFLYEQFLEMGYIPPNPIEMRIRERFELKGNISMFAILRCDEIIATIGVIPDGEHGLPIDAHLSSIVNEYRLMGKICEISNWAISPEFRGKREVMRSLVKAVALLCWENDIEYVLGEATPKHERSLRRLFGFEPIGDEYCPFGDDLVQGVVLELSDPEIERKLDLLFMSDEGDSSS